jgi:hypothetical protein
MGCLSRSSAGSSCRFEHSPFSFLEIALDSDVLLSELDRFGVPLQRLTLKGEGLLLEEYKGIP